MNNLVLRDSDIFIPRRSLLSDPGVMPESPYIGVDALSRSQRRWSRYSLQPRTTLVPYTIGLHGLGLDGTGCCGAVPGTAFPALSGCCASCDRGGPCRGAGGCGGCDCAGAGGCGGCDCSGVGELSMWEAQSYVLPVLVGAGLGYLARGSLLGTAIGGLLGAGAYWAYNRVETGIVAAVSAVASGQAPGQQPAARLANPRPLPGLSGFLNDLDPRPGPGEDATAAHSRASFRYLQLGVALSAVALFFEVTTRRRGSAAARTTNKRRSRRRNGRRYEVGISSQHRYRASASERRLWGGKTVTQFLIEDPNHEGSARWIDVMGYGATPGERRTDALRRYARKIGVAEVVGKLRPQRVDK